MYFVIFVKIFYYDLFILEECFVGIVVDVLVLVMKNYIGLLGFEIGKKIKLIICD